MNICVVGWYGTETLGDRSILMGIVSIFSHFLKNTECQVHVGSLYPFYTKRALYEDEEFYLELAPNCKIDYFDVKNNTNLKRTIMNSDYVIMGGGPLMDLEELMYIQKIFEFAHKKGKKTIIFGCGVGPITRKEFKECVFKIIENSDLCIFRDSISKEKAIEICQLFRQNMKTSNMYVTYDPAFIPPLYYKEKYCKDVQKTKEVGINLRDYPFSLSNDKRVDLLNTLSLLIKDLTSRNLKVVLLPNHNFHVGGDDREYYSDIYLDNPDENLEIIYKPLSLKETFDKIRNMKYCIGMRYHAILFQTIINGNNYILDYTEPDLGKISGFLNTINGWDFYQDRYFNILDCPKHIMLENKSYKINLQTHLIISDYMDILKKLL